MPTQLELLAEANRRGILPPEKKPLFDEAVKRGLIQDNGSQPPVQQTLPGDVEFKPLLDAFQSEQPDTVDRLRNTGVTPGNAMEFAALHIQKRNRELAALGQAPLDTNQQLAIEDIYKNAAGRKDTSNQNFFQQNRKAALAARRETIGGRVVDAFAGYEQNLGDTGLKLLGTVAPEKAKELQDNVDLVYGTDPNSRAAKAGNFTAEAVKMATISKLLGPKGMAALYGAQGFGDTRVEAARLRDEGQQVGVGTELSTAASIGGIEALSGYVSGKIFDKMSRVVQAGSPQLRALLMQGDKTAIKHFVAESAKLTGGMLSEGTEEAATQLIENKIKKMGMNPKQALSEGVAEAFVQGTLLSPFGELAHRGKTHGHEGSTEGVGEGSSVPDANVGQPLAEGLGDVAATPGGVGGSDTGSPLPTPGRTEVVAVSNPAGSAPVSVESMANEIVQMNDQLNAARAGMQNGTTGDAGADAQIDTLAANVQQKLADFESVAGEDAAEALMKRLAPAPAAAPAVPAGESSTQETASESAAKPNAAEAQGPATSQTEQTEQSDYSKMATEPGRPVEAKVNGETVKGKYESVAMNGDHFVRAENGQLHRVAHEDLRVTPDEELPVGQKKGLPKVPAAARDWSFTKLKAWAKENGYSVNTKHNLDSIRKAIRSQRNESLIDLPKPPKSMRTMTFKRFKYWAKQNGYDVSNVKTRLELKREIKRQRSAELAVARAPKKETLQKQSPISEDERVTLRRELAETKKKYMEEAAARRTDPLTGAANLVAYDEDTSRVFKEADATNEHVAVAESDLGNFKVANDELGHEVGDKLLQAEAESIREALRMPEQKGRPADYPGSIGYRIGGDEFPALLRNVSDPKVAESVLQRASEIFDKKAKEIIGDRLPKEAYPFISWGVEIRKPGDTRTVKELRHAAEAQVIPNKNKIKRERGVPETREGLQKFIEQRKAMAKRARASVEKAAPLEGTAHARRVPKFIEGLLTPLASRVRDLSPRLFDRLMRMEYSTGRKREKMKRDLHDPAARLTESLGGKNSDQYRAFKKAVLNGDFDAVYKMLPTERHGDFDAFVKNTFPGLLEEMQKQGVNAGRLDNYWPRFIKDYKAFDAIYGDDKGRFEEAWDMARDIKGKRLLTAAEKAEIANSVIQGYGPVKIGALGMPNARERSIESVSDEQLDHYLDPLEAAFRYIDGATYAAERAKFMGKAKTAEQLPQTMGRIVQEEISNEKLDKDAQQELIDLLTTRFQADMLVMPKAARNFKQMIYLSTLGQFRSAVTQVTDAAITAAQHGIPSTISGIKKALRIGPAEKRFIMEEIGIHDHGEEFKDVGKIAKLTDTVLRWTGFKTMDRFGKEGRINGAWDAMQAAAKDENSSAFKELEREYKPVFGEKEWASTVEDLKAGRKTENTRYMLFLDVAKVQPLTMSQMPEKYLKMSSGRILYALKTFTLTQLDMVRRDMVRDALTPGRRRVGLAKLGRYVFLLTLLGFSKDLLVDLIRGKTVKADDMPARSMDAMLATVGLNKYTVDNAAKEPSKAAMNFLAPPISWIDGTWKDITTGGMKKSAGDDESKFAGLNTVRSLPVIGELLYFWSPLGRGFHMEKDKANQEYNSKLAELRKEAEIAMQEGDADSAQFLMQIYNERRRNGPDGQQAARPKPRITIATVREGLHRKAVKQERKEKK